MGWQIAEGFGGQVTLANGIIYIINDRKVDARREEDGSLLWSWMPPAGKPQGTMIATRNLLFVTTEDTTYAVELGAHVDVWTYPAAGALSLSRDGLLFIAQPTGTLTAIDIRQ